jgi:outer membrane protein assembly factor BamE (lipoprotein component of BamABCDE complex)
VRTYRQYRNYRIPFGEGSSLSEDASGFQYAFRIVRAKNHLNVGMTKSEVISLIGSEPDRVHHAELLRHYTWSTAYRVGTITRLIYDPAPHGQYLEVTFDRDERVVTFDWSEI